MNENISQQNIAQNYEISWDIFDDVDMLFSSVPYFIKWVMSCA